MKVLKDKGIKDIPVFKSDIDDTSDMDYIPPYPLPAKNFALYLVGAPKSGKTSLMMSLLLSHPTRKRKNIPRFFYKVFDRIEFISASHQTLPKRFRDKLPEDQIHPEYSDDLLMDIITELKDGDNTNNLLVFDDVIRSLNRSKILSKIYLNRRHATYDNTKEGKAGLSIITTSQKYSLLDLCNRVAQSDIILFKSSNATEINRIKDELLHDLSKEEQEDLLRLAWSEPYSFLYIKMNEPKHKKYFVKFNPVVFEE